MNETVCSSEPEPLVSGVVPTAAIPKYAYCEPVWAFPGLVQRKKSPVASHCEGREPGANPSSKPPLLINWADAALATNKNPIKALRLLHLGPGRLSISIVANALGRYRAITL